MAKKDFLEFIQKVKKNFTFYGFILTFIVFFIASAIIFKVYQIEILPSQFYGALIGVFITAIVTAFLLRGQTAGDEKREKSVKVFEKKQEVYYNFLEKLKEIIQDGEIHIGTKNKDGSVNNSIDELKDLIFQFAYLQLHTSNKTINGVVEKVSKLIQHLNDFNSIKDVDKKNELAEFYSSLSNEIFGITTLLKKDLYDEDCEPISKEKMNEILRECDLFVETNDFDKYELQNYFLSELQKQLIQKGYNIKEKDFTQDVNNYYARARNRHRYYGIEFPLSINNKTIQFKIEMDNSYYYGFPKPELNKQYPELVNIIQQLPNTKKENGWWFGWKYSDRYNLNFWNFDSEDSKKLKNPNPSQRKKLLADIAEEIHQYIEVFIQKAKENNL
jgi:gas vesicle protein